MVKPDEMTVSVDVDAERVQRATEAVRELRAALEELDGQSVDISVGNDTGQPGQETQIPMERIAEIGDLAAEAIADHLGSVESPDEVRVLGVEAPNIVRWELDETADSNEEY